jgi:hypothetical protein
MNTSSKSFANILTSTPLSLPLSSSSPFNPLIFLSFLPFFILFARFYIISLTHITYYFSLGKSESHLSTHWSQFDWF